MSIINKFFSLIIKVHNRIFIIYYKSRFGFCAKSADVNHPLSCTCFEKVYLYENTQVAPNAQFIISPVGEKGRFILKKNSGAAEHLTVITGNHSRKVGEWYTAMSATHSIDKDQDVVVDEDVWIGANVSLLAGVHIGRGANIGSGAVVRHDVPPYAIVVGNPAKIVGFSFTPDEIIEHEKSLYQKEERLPLEDLEQNYEKYFLKRLKEIKEFNRP